MGHHLFTFLATYKDWVSSVVLKILGKKKILVEDYCYNLYSMATPVDQLDLLILAHMYHRHFCVFLHNGVWTTRRNNSMEYCKIFFVYKGNSDLCDTVLTDIFNPVELAYLLYLLYVHLSIHRQTTHFVKEHPHHHHQQMTAIVVAQYKEELMMKTNMKTYSLLLIQIMTCYKEELRMKTNSLLLLQIVLALNKKELRMKTNSLLLQLNDQGQHQKSLSTTQEQKKF